MSPWFAYFLGLITILIILIPLWILSAFNDDAAEAYSVIFCDQLPPGT